MSERNLAQDMKKELIETEKYYSHVKMELSKVILNDVTIEERTVKAENEKNGDSEYSIHIVLPSGKDAVIGTINKDSRIVLNEEILENKDGKFSDDDMAFLGNMLNVLGLEQNKVDINKLKEQLNLKKSLTREELEHERKKEKDEKIKDDDSQTENDEEDKEEDNEDKKDKRDESELEQKRIAARKGLRARDIFIPKKFAKIFENYPQLKEEKDLYFYRDKDGKVKAEYTDKDGNIQSSKFFNDSNTNMTEQVVGLRDQGEPIKKERPYQVMTTNGLVNTNKDAREVRIAIYFGEYGEMNFEEIRQGTNGKWTGYGIERQGRDYNSHLVNELSSTKTNKVDPAEISEKYEKVENTGLAADDIQIEDLSPRKTIERFMEEGYNKKEAISIYNYMIGEEKLPEDVAKQKVNEEIALKNQERPKEGRDPGEEAYDRLVNRRR